MVPTHPAGLFPVPGDGVLARRGDLILLCSLDASQLAEQLLDLLDRAADAGDDGRRLTDAVADAVESADSAGGASVLAFGPAGAGLAVTVCGGAWAEVSTPDGTVRVEAAHASMLLRSVLRTPVTGVRGGLSRADDGAASADRFSRLDAGTVRAGGLSFYQEGPAAAAPPAEELPPEPPPPADPVLEPTAAWVPSDAPDADSAQAERRATEHWTPPPPEPYSSGQPFESMLLADADVEPRQPLPTARDLVPGTSYVSAGPVIQGVYCPNGHFDDPEAAFCAVCGISMNQQTLVPGPGQRPPLGVLLLDDGSVFQLDGDYVIGREPSLDASVAAGQARALRVTDESGIVSRVHAMVALDGWRVLVTDLGSANGTRVYLAGQPAPQELMPQMPMVLTPGSQVDLGGRGFRYESHRGR